MKFLLKIVATFFILIFFVWFLGASLLQTERGKKWILDNVTAYIEKELGAQVHIKSIDFIFPLNLDIDGLKIEKDQLPIIAVDHIEVSVLQTLSIYAKNVTLSNFLPLFSESNSNPFSFSSKVKIDNLTIDPASIPSYLHEWIQDSKLQINGYVSSSSSLIAHLQILVENKNRQPLHFTIDTENQVLSISLHANQFDYLANTGSLSIFAEGPFKDWTHVFHSDPNQISKINGSYKVYIDSLVEKKWLEKSTIKGKFAYSSTHHLECIDSELENPNFNFKGNLNLDENQMIEKGYLIGEILNPEVVFSNYLTTSPIDVEAKISKNSVNIDLQTPSLKMGEHSIQHVYSIITLNENSGTAELAFEYNENKENITSSFTLNESHLTLNDMILKGALEGTGTLKVEISKDPIFDLQGKHFKYKDWSGNDFQIKGKWEELDLFAKSLKGPLFTAENLKIQKQQEEIYFETENFNAKDIILTGIKGNVFYHSNVFRLASFNGFFGPYPIKIFKELFFSYQPNHLEIKNLHFSLGEGEFQGEVVIDNQNLQSTIIGTYVPSELLHFVAPEAPITGRFSFHSELQGPLDLIQGKIKVLLHHIQITEPMFANHPFIEGEWDLFFDDNRLNLKGLLTGIGRNPIHASGFLPYYLSSKGLIPNKDNTLELTLNAEGELDPYLNLFYNESSNMTGHAKIALLLHGKLDSPQINGTVDLTDGTYESFSTGALYKNIEASLEGNGSKLILKHFSAQDNKQGSITAEGHVLLENHFPFEFQLYPKEMYIMDSDYATISASGDLTLKGNKNSGILSGSLQADQAIIRMDEVLPTSIKSIDFKYVNHQEKNGPTPTKWAMNLDVTLNAPKQVIIEGKNLDSEWRGMIKATGTTEKLFLDGELRIVNGTYTFNGKEFLLSQGNIHFAGPPGKKTTLYVVASKELERIKAEIIVKGPVNKLAVSFRSNPPLSQREVLSYILFNRGIADITPDQTEQLTHSFIDLDTKMQSSSQNDVLSRLRNNIGIDRLDFTSTDRDNKDLAVQVGKYIADGVMVSINKSISASANRVALEANLMKNWKAQADMGDDSQGRIMLKWKKDY